jgi:hypothetical protein
MNFKTTILLLIVLAGIGAYVIVTHNSGPSADQTPQPSAAQGAKLIDLSADSVARISIKPANGSEIVLEKAGSDWKLTKPTVAPADPSAVSALVGALVDLRSTSQLPADQKAAAGLDQPPYTVALTDSAGKSTSLAFGPKPAIGDALDVVVNNRDQADVVSAGIYSQLEQPDTAYRKMNLVSVGADKIQQVHIERTDAKSFQLHKTGDKWVLLDGQGFDIGNADSSAAGDITMALAGLSAKQFVTEQHPLSYFGLAKPSMTVWFSTTAPPAKDTGSMIVNPHDSAVTILFGRPVDVTKADIYASVDGQVVTLPNITADTFRKSPLDLRDKTVLDIDPATVNSVQVVADRAPEAKALGPNLAPQWDMTYERKEESHVAGPPLPATGPAKPESHWNVVSGMRVGIADDARVDGLLLIFHPMTAQKYIESAATTQPASTYDVTIKTATGKTVTVKITDQGGDNPLIGSYVNAIFELDRAILSKIIGK